ncbi:uncharacterized protein LOC143179573 [Calliopsis andreniformis]|uniref:uncharacterized protein LOC143179573 n=1 Tax=Calliopsis andreniformis TaxID=337506 RepID=UPI003FCD0F7A
MKLIWEADALVDIYKDRWWSARKLYTGWSLRKRFAKSKGRVKIVGNLIKARCTSEGDRMRASKDEAGKDRAVVKRINKRRRVEGRENDVSTVWQTNGGGGRERV